MSSPVLVAADLRLEHLLMASPEDMVWYGWTLGGPSVRAIAQYSDATFVAGSDEIAAKAVALLPHGAHVLQGAGRTAQTFRIGGPALSFAPARETTSRCPFCSHVHALDRHNRPGITDEAADLLVTDSLRSDVLAFAMRRRPALGAVAVLDDPSVFRFSPASDIASRLRQIEALVASPQFASILARRLAVERSALAGSLGTRVVEAHDAQSEMTEDPWRQLMTAGPLELAVRHVLEERLGRTFEPPLAPPLHQFSTPVRLSELRARNSACPVCGTPFRQVRAVGGNSSTRSVGISHNLGWLRRRTLNAADKADAISAAQRLLSWQGNAYVVASGGSAVAGAYIAQLLRERTSLFATEAFPSDYAKNGARTDALVLVSYSGNTPDHLPVIRRARRLGVQRIALISHSLRPRLRPELGSGGLVIAYGNPRREPRAERGFVSLAATVAPCALMLAALDGPPALVPLAARYRREAESLGRLLGEALRANYEVHVLGSGYARPAMLDLESKWVEGGLGPLTLHQSKDFSHGRFMSLLGSGRRIQPIMLSVGTDPYEQELTSTLLDEHRASEGVVGEPRVLASTEEGLLGGLQLLIEVQEVAAHAGQMIGRDLSRPERIDPGGLRLYAWKDEQEARPSSGLLRATGDGWRK